MTPTPTSPSPKNVTRPEFYWIAGAIVFGSLLRLAFPDRIAIEHFDEGVYASNFWFGPESGYAYPMRHLYAPPFLPLLIEWTMTLASMMGIEPRGWIPVIPSLAAGLLMIPSIWWICRSWFGATAGLTSAWLVAISDLHCCYSRAALTDVPVLFLILWSVYFIGRAFRSLIDAMEPSVAGKPTKDRLKASLPLGWTVAAGVTTAMAWSTKYSGWLPLAVGITAIVIWRFRATRSVSAFVPLIKCWVMIAGVACLCWSPVLWQLQSTGGYSAVAANHRQYVVGLTGWPQSAWKQFQNISFYEAGTNLWSFPPERLTIPGVEAGIAGRQIAMRANSPVQMIYPAVIGLAALLVCFVVLRDWRNDPRLISACLVIAWLGGMTVATPMYHPYPRLVLPWLCAIWICLGMGMQWIEESQGTNLVVRFLRGKLPLLTAILAVIAFGRSATGLAQTWQDRADLQRVAAKIAETVREETAKRGTPANESIVYVFGEPALVFGLKSLGFPLVGPAQNLQFASQPAVRPTFIAVPDTAGALSESDRLALSQAPFERVLSESFQKSHLVQNDDVSSTSRRGRIALYQLAK